MISDEKKKHRACEDLLSLWEGAGEGELQGSPYDVFYFIYFILFIFLYSRFLLVINFIHISVLVMLSDIFLRDGMELMGQRGVGRHMDSRHREEHVQRP